MPGDFGPGRVLAIQWHDDVEAMAWPLERKRRNGMTEDKARTDLPPLGMPVFSNDGAHLGHVAEYGVRMEHFKVDAPMAPYFWLPFEHIERVGPEYVLLRLGQREVRSERIEGDEPMPPETSPLDFILKDR
jgi:hypothetical protein